MSFGHSVLLQTGPIVLDQPVSTLPVVDDARWSAGLTSHSWAALLVWIGLLVVLQIATWPLARRLFPRFPDQGWAFARLMTLLLAGIGVWYGASLEIISFRAWWAAVAVVVVGVIAWVLGRRVAPPVVVTPWFRQRAILASEVVFWAVFALFLLFRFLNPDAYHQAWGGEKPMEFAHINAILRSAHFPPFDPWYAEGVLNYYYYGMYLVAFMMKLTGIPSEIAFNLAQPTIIAFLAAGAFSVSMAIGRSLSRKPVVVFAGGLAGLVLVSFSGNLVAAARAFTAITSDSPPLSDYGYWFWTPTRIVAYTINEFPWFTATYADLHAHVVALGLTVLVIGLAFSLVQSPRPVALAAGRPMRNRGEAIQVWGALVLTGVTLGSLYMTNAWDVPTYAALAVAAVFLATRGVGALGSRLVVSVGMVALVNLLALLVALPFIQNYVSLYGELETNRTTSAPIEVMSHFGVFFLIALFGLSLAYLRSWERPVPVWLGPVAALGLLGLLIVRWYGVERSAVWIERADLAIAAAVMFWFVALMSWPQERTFDFGLPDWMRGLYPLLYAAAVAGMLATDRIAGGLFLAIGLPALLLAISRGNIGERFSGLLVAGAMLIGAAMELVFLVDGLSGGDWYRMNTVFKFYNQVWVLAGIGSAGLVAMMVRQVVQPPVLVTTETVVVETVIDASAEDAEAVAGEADVPLVVQEREVVTFEAPQWWSLGTGAWARVSRVVTGLAVLASLAFPLLSTGARLQQRYPQDGAVWTLNGLDWMNYGEQAIAGPFPVSLSYDDDRAIIDWFNTEVPGTPVIAEASLSQYLCATARIANYTGLPSVIGWPWHEVQQRDWSDIGQRQDDVRLLYTSTHVLTKQEIIARYDIDYIVVSDLERYYPAADCTATDNAAGVAAFDQMVANGNLEVAFRSGDAVVYRVISAG